MPSTSFEPPALLVYYGRGFARDLARFDRVVLQPESYDEVELAYLASNGTRTLAYVSLTEDPDPAPRPWHRGIENEAWGTHYVRASHGGWRNRVENAMSRALEAGFGGLFLDTLDPVERFPEDRDAVLTLARTARSLADDGYVLANRGFGLLEDLGPLVDGFLFEAFSTTWRDGYRAVPSGELLENVATLHRLQALHRDVYALDYADTESLAAFARARAKTHGLPSQVSDRMLTTIP